MTYEPEDASNLAGYWLALSLTQAAEGAKPGGRVGVYGGTAEDTQIFVKSMEGMDFRQMHLRFVSQHPEGAIFACGIVNMPSSENNSDFILVHVYDYVHGLAIAMAVPYVPLLGAQEFLFGDPEVLEAWGPLKENKTFKLISRLNLLRGLEESPNYPLFSKAYSGNLLKSSN